MSRSLLDINVLLALFDADHIDHGRAHKWLDTEVETGWASCAITENGFVRIVSQPRYPNSVSPSAAIDLLRQACDTPHHEFWACDASILDPQIVDRSRVHGPKQITDVYLLALAVQNSGRLVTFDRAISLSSVQGATAEHMTVI